MATAAPGARATAGAVAPVLAALLRRALRDARTRTIGFGWLFAVVSYLEPVAYRHAYPTLADRVHFAHSFAHNAAVVMFYGRAYDLLTVGGYTAWRVGGTLAIFAAVFGMLTASRGLRGEEDAGRQELVLAAPVGRGAVFGASLGAIAVSTGVLWLAAVAGLIAGGLPAAGSLYLALTVTSTAAVFVAAGALIGQLASSQRTAIELGGALVALCLALRLVGDSVSGAGWLDWATPLGWAEQLRPFTGARPLVLLAPIVTSGVLISAAARIAAGRDVGTGLLVLPDRRAPRLGLLSSPTAQALRGERIALALWATTVGSLAAVVGVVSKSVSALTTSRGLQQALERLGAGSALTARTYIGFAFGSLVLAICLFGISQVSAARHEESEDRLGTLLALPVSRRRWLGGRLLLAVGGATVISLSAGLLAWLGAISQGVSLSLLTMLVAGVNCLPAALLFLGVAALGYAALPRAGIAIAYALLIAAYLWQLLGSLLGVPSWLAHVTPFAHIAAVPAVAFRATPAAVMAVLGSAACVAAVGLFARRDLNGSGS